MTKMEKMPNAEFKKLSKKEQQRINNLRRIPTAAPGSEFDRRVKPRTKRWDSLMDE